MTDSARRRSILLIILPALGAAMAAIVATLLLPDLPASVAVHWGPDGTVDRVDGVGAVVGTVAILVPAFVALVLGFSIRPIREGTSRAYLRVAIALTSWFGAFVSIAMFGTVLAQRSQTDPLAAPLSTAIIPLVAAFVVSSAAAWLISRHAPEVRAAEPISADARELPLASSELAYWSASANSPSGVIALPAVVGTGLGLLFIVFGLPWWTVFLLVPFYHAITSILVWRVVVDRHGLTATGLFGYPRIRVPLDDIVDASAVDVKPLSDFGGWGIRMGLVGRASRWGIIVRGGSAIEVQRDSGTAFVVTVDDAETGAALLTSLARRQRV